MPATARRLRVALNQFAPRPGDLDGNLRELLEALREAGRRRASLLVAPEMSLTGWSLPDASERSQLAEEVRAVAVPALADAADRSGVSLIVGAPFPGPGGPSNCAVGIGPAGRRAVYRKVHPFGPERDWWEPGDRVDALLDVDGVRVGLTICYDAEFPEIPRALRLRGADLLAVVATNMSPYERDQQLVFPTRALENECPVLVCNRVGTERGWTFFGRSLVADARGAVLGRAGEDSQLLVSDVPVPGSAVDPDLSYLAHRRPEVYRPLAEALSSPGDAWSRTATPAQGSPVKGR